MADSIEKTIGHLLSLIPKHHMMIMGSSESEKVEQLIAYLNDGKEKGYSSFFTYRVGQNIANHVRANRTLALLSSTEFIRILAHQIETIEL